MLTRSRAHALTNCNYFLAYAGFCLPCAVAIAALAGLL